MLEPGGARRLMVKAKIDPRAVPEPLVWQREILAQPTSSWVALCGGRYSGKSHLSILLLVQALGPVGWVVSIKVKTTDRYGRTVAELYRNGRSLNLTMVSSGEAFAFR